MNSYDVDVGEKDEGLLFKWFWGLVCFPHLFY